MCTNNHYNQSLITTYTDLYFLSKEHHFPHIHFLSLNIFLLYYWRQTFLFFFDLQYCLLKLYVSLHFFILLSVVCCQSDQLIAEWWYWALGSNCALSSPSTLPAYCSSVGWNKIRQRNNSQRHFWGQHVAN